MEHQVADADISQVVAWLKSEKFPVQCPSTQSWKLKSLWSQRSCPLLRDGILYRRWEYIPNGGVCKRLQLVLPSSLISSILSGMHDSLVGGGGGGASWHKEDMGESAFAFLLARSEAGCGQMVQQLFCVQLQEVTSKVKGST